MERSTDPEMQQKLRDIMTVRGIEHVRRGTNNSFTIIFAALAVMVILTSCTTLPATPRPPPDRPDYSQLYEDFGDFRMAGRYPFEAAQIGQEGRVMLEFAVDTNGCVSDMSVVESSPRGYFEEAAMAPFIDHCFAHPNIVGGEAVEVLDIPFLMSFQLAE